MAVEVRFGLLQEPVHNEVPGGLVNGVNATFTTFFQFKTGSTKLFRNGVRQEEGPSADYVENVGLQSITFLVAPLAGDVLLIDYVRVS